MARRRRKPRPPEALRRLFKSRARSLEGAILSLLPTPPPSSPEDCPSCRGCLCLGCLGRSHLVEDGDPLEYRRLLDRAFCVVSAEAPPPPTVYRCNGWDQRQIVRNTRDLLWNSRKCNNALCIGQEGNNCLNSTNDVLCSHPWGLLLERIGDQLMVFLLRFSSIFLPLTNKRYHQVTGPPLNEFLPSLPVPSSSLKSQIQQSSLYLQNHVHIELEHSLTKKQVGKEGKPKKSSCTPRRHSSRYSKIINGGSIPLHFHDMHIEQFVRPSHNDYSARESCDTDEFHYPSICTSKSKSKKRTRYFSWHRNKKFKKLELFRPVAPDVGTEVASWKDWIVSGTPQCGQWIGTGVIIDDEVDIVHAAQVNHGKNVSLSVESNRSFPETLSANEQEKGGYSNMGSYEIQPATSGKTLNIASSHNDRTQTILQTESSDKLPVKDHGSSMKLKRYHHKKMTFQCFYCMALQTAGKVSLGDQIKRHFIFYNRSSTYFTFPRRHILERLKANEAGAISLMKSIFGFPSEESQSNTRFSGSCGLKCQCLYHRLLSLLKSLIQNAHRCRYRTLLLKHCVFPNFARCGKDSSGSTSERVGEGILSSLYFKRACIGSQPLSNHVGSESLTINIDLQRKNLHDNGPNICDPELDLNECFASHQQVGSFIWAVTRSIVPEDLLGDISLRRALKKNISKFVALHKCEKFSLKQCINGLKPSLSQFFSKVQHCSCTCKKDNIEFRNFRKGKESNRKSNHVRMSLQKRIFHSWIYWFFAYIIVPLISTMFYVTERQSGRQHVYYYPKPLWRKLVDRSITSLENQNYVPLNYAAFRNVISRRKFGFSRVRFLPKQKSIRIVANTKIPCKILFPIKKKRLGISPELVDPKSEKIFFYYKSVNSALRYLFLILRRVKVEFPTSLGSSVFDYNGIHQRMYQFIHEVKDGSHVMPMIYIVAVDISRAFDTLDQNTLVNIVKSLVQNDKYLIRSYMRIVCTKKAIRALYEKISYDCHSNDGDITEFGSSTQFYSSYGILIDQGRIESIDKERLHLLLTEHLKNNILQIGHTFYLQKTGITQGSCVSALLCSFYYAHLEKTMIFPFLEKTIKQPVIVDSDKHDMVCQDKEHCFQKNHASRSCTDGARFKNLSSPKNLLLRLIDDFLFISTSRAQATSFFNKMNRGFEKYNCKINKKKIGLNFEVIQFQNFSNRIYIGADGIQFLPWSGLLLNCQTLEIQADYTRYLDVHISSTITVQVGSSPYCELKAKLHDYMRPKCHPIFYDSTVNSAATVRLNAYQAFLLGAMKFHCYVYRIPNNAKLNPSYLLDMIEQSLRYMHKLIKKHTENMEAHFNIHPVLKLKKREIIWLGLSAYIWVLKKKQSSHKKLLSLLRCKIATYGRMEGASAPLKYAVDDSHSFLFSKLKF